MTRNLGSLAAAVERALGGDRPEYSTVVVSTPAGDYTGIVDTISVEEDTNSSPGTFVIHGKFLSYAKTPHKPRVVQEDLECPAFELE